MGEPPPLRTRTAREGGREECSRARWSRGGERYDRPLSVVFEKVEAARSLARVSVDYLSPMERTDEEELLLRREKEESQFVS